MSSQKRTFHETVFACSYGAQVEFLEEMFKRFCDTVPLQVIMILFFKSGCNLVQVSCRFSHLLQMTKEKALMSDESEKSFRIEKLEYF